MGATGVLLAWARDRDGARVRATDLDPRDRRARAPFSCIGCGETLVPRLGRIRARHFAHRPGSSCPLTAPESALHLDVKERLLALCRAAFALERRVVLLARCPICRRSAPADLAAMGDSAVAEGAVGPLRADVLVLLAGRPALAFEVKVTHAVDPRKQDALGAASVPAVEVDAWSGWQQEGEDGATAIACARSLGFPPCPACATLSRAERERARGGEAAEIADLEAYRARGLFGRVAAETRELADLVQGFRCPECGGADVEVGRLIARHACPGGTARPIAWLGYDGKVASLSWWRRGRRS